MNIDAIEKRLKSAVLRAHATGDAVDRPLFLDQALLIAEVRRLRRENALLTVALSKASDMVERLRREMSELKQERDTALSKVARLQKIEVPEYKEAG